MPVEGVLNPINSMQSEAGLPRIIMGTPLRKQSSERSVPTSERRAVKRAPKYRDSFIRTGPACMSTRSLTFPRLAPIPPR